MFGIMLGLGVLGVWIGMFVDWAARSVMFVWRFKSGKSGRLSWNNAVAVFCNRGGRIVYLFRVSERAV